MSVKYNWPKLKAEFLENDNYVTARTWLREAKGWSDEEILAGNTAEHIIGWGIARAKHQHEKRKAAQEQSQAVIEALTPMLIEAKANIILHYLDILENGELIEERVGKDHKPRKFRRALSLQQRSHILTKLKTELGEPAVITKQNTDDPERGASVMEAVLIAYGIKDKDGKLLIGSNKPTEPTDAQE